MNEDYKLFYELISKYKFFKRKDFFNGELITNYIKNRNRIFFLLSGDVELLRKDRVIANYKKNNLFCENFVNIKNTTELSLIAKHDGEILYFTLDDIDNSSISYEKKYQILNLLFKILGHEFTFNTERVNLLIIKSTRDKLLNYFHHTKHKKNSNTFILDYNYTELADYLGIDRSAMMREIKILIDDGIIKKEGKHITIIS